MSIADNIRNLRVERELSQKSFAEKIGMSQALIAQYENGTKVPSVSSIMSMAEALRVSTDDIIIGGVKK